MESSEDRIIIPPLKIQGIKTKLVPWIRQLLTEHNVPCDGRWIEPFMGSGVVGFNIGRLFSRQLMCDTNPHIVEFYKLLQDGIIDENIVRHDLREDDKLLREEGESYYRHTREWYNLHHTPATAFLFLSRACFNGMMRFNSKGEFNVPFCKKPERFSKAYITKICNQVRAVRETISTGDWQFQTQDFRTTIKEAVAGDIIYCDPPYFGRHVDYYNGWTENDESDLAELLTETPAKFILSTWHHNDYRENEMISKYWSRFNIVTHEHFYHVGARESNRRGVTEALIFNF